MDRFSLPAALQRDPVCLYVKRRRPRLWILLCDMECLRAEWHPDDVSRWTTGIWAVNLDRREHQFAKDVEELRSLGLMEPSGFRLRMTRQRAEAPEAVRERQRRHRNGRSGEDVTADVTADVTQFVTEFVDGLAHARVTEQISSDLSEQNDPVLNNRTETEQSEQSDQTVAADVQAGIRPVMEPPKSIVEEYVDVGMDRAEAERRYREFGEQRMRDALESLPYQKKPIGKPVGWLIEFLVKGWELPYALVQKRKREASEREQGRMTMLAIEERERVLTTLPKPAEAPFTCGPPSEDEKYREARDKLSRLRKEDLQQAVTQQMAQNDRDRRMDEKTKEAREREVKKAG